MTALDACLKQVNRLRHLNAFIRPHLTRDDVITQPNTTSQPRPLEQMVFSVKNNYAVKNHPMSCGSAFLSHYRPVYTATVVSRILSAGGILIGHCNMDEFAMGAATLTSHFGPCYNPWGEEREEIDLTKRYPRVTGGSSGGSAVSVVTGQCQFSLGSDTGGSVRGPAAYCGLVGLKPSYGALSRHGLAPLTSSTDCPGIFARDVQTISLVFDVISGPDPLDTTSVHIPECAQPRNGPLRIGMLRYSNQWVEECMETCFQEALEDLRSDYDVTIEEIDLPHFKYGIHAYNTITAVEAASNMSKYIGILYGEGSREVLGSGFGTAEEPFCEKRHSLLGPLVQHRILYGTFLSSQEGIRNYEQAARMRRAIIDDFKVLNSCDGASGNGYDVIITPSMTGEAPRSDVTTAMGPVASNALAMFSKPANLAGLPAACVPIGLSSDGMPLGLQVIGAWRQDRKVLNVAEMVLSCSRHAEEVRDGIDRLCPLD